MSSFQENLARLRAKQAELAPNPAETAPKVAQTPIFTDEKVKSSLDDGAKRELRQISILPVYREWFQPLAENKGLGDEVNVSCFNTDYHRRGDKNPGLGINTAKNTYYCHACQVTGDIIDLAAIRLGLHGSDWRCPPDQVHEAVKYAGEELAGMSFRKTAAGWQRIPPHEPESMPMNAPDQPKLSGSAAKGVPSAAPGAGPCPHVSIDGATGRCLTCGDQRRDPAPPIPRAVAYTPPGGMVLADYEPLPYYDPYKPNVAAFAPPEYTGPRPVAPPEDEDEAEERRIRAALFELNWRDIVPEGTPLRNYMEIVTADDTPEEFHFWNFMSIIGLAMGRKVFLPDVKPVYGNMLLCLIGRTGQGKSRSESFAHELIRSAMPFKEDDQHTNGVRMINNPGSGEFLTRMFHHEIPDPADPSKSPKMLVNPSVKGLVLWPEMATMAGKASGSTSIIRTTVISLYDTPAVIGGGSLMNGSYEARNPFGNVSTTTQLSAVRTIMSRDDAASGFLNRWWFVIGKNKDFQPWGAHVNIAPVKADVELLVKWAEDKFRNDSGWHKLSREAMALSSEFIVNRCRPLEIEDGNEMHRRAVLTFKKLILLFSANMMESEVSVYAVEQAKVAFEYLMDCLRHVGTRLTSSDFEEKADPIIEIINNAGDEGITGRDIRKTAKTKKYGMALEQVNMTIASLEKSGMIELKTLPPKGGIGRPQKRYFVTSD